MNCTGLTVQEYYDETDLLRGKLDLLSNTSMVDFAMDVHKSLYPDQEVPPTLKDKRTQVVENFKKLQADTEPVLKIFADPEVTRQIQQSRDSKQLFDFLVKGYEFKTEMIDVCYNFAKFQVPIVLYCTVLHCTVLYCTVLYCTVYD